MGQSLLKGQGFAIGQGPFPGRVLSRCRVAGPRQDSRSGGSMTEVQKVRAKATLFGLEQAKTSGPLGAMGHSPGPVPMVLHEAAS